MKKIALINNMNNNFFSLYRYFEERGYDVSLFRFDDGFDPSADSFRPRDSIKLYEIDLIARPYSWFKWLFLRRKLKRLFRGQYDCIFACGASVAYLHRIGVHVDVIIPTGGDLYDYTTYTKGVKGVKWSYFWLIGVLFWFNFAFHQRKGFTKARHVVTNPNHVLFRSREEALPKMNLLNLPIPMLYDGENYLRAVDGRWKELEGSEFIVFNHSRQYWKTNYNAYSEELLHGVGKRNDKLIRAFADFVANTKLRSPLLVLFEYGIDVSASKRLVRDLRIESHVKWVPKMERKYIMQGLKYAHFGVDQLREGICGIGGTSQEVLASGVPLITYSNGETANPESIYYEAPIIDVLDTNQISAVFADYEQNPLKYERMRTDIAQWYRETFGSAAISPYIDLIERGCEV